LFAPVDFVTYDFILEKREENYLWDKISLNKVGALRNFFL
jgi:hypothetical protein